MPLSKRMFAEVLLTCKLNELAASTREGRIIHFTWSILRDVILAFVEYQEACLEDMQKILDQMREVKNESDNQPKV